MTADDDNGMLKTSSQIATVTFLLLFVVYVCVQFSLLTGVIIMTIPISSPDYVFTAVR